MANTLYVLAAKIQIRAVKNSVLTTITRFLAQKYFWKNLVEITTNSRACISPRNFVQRQFSHKNQTAQK